MPKIIKDGVAYGDGVMVDTALDATSENPVQNKVVTGEINDIKSALTNKATSEITDYAHYSVAIVGNVVTVSGRTSGSSYGAGSVIVSDLPLSVGGYLPVMLFNASMSTYQYGYLLNGKLYTENAISGGTAHFAFSYVKANS